VSKKICVEPALFYQGVYEGKGEGTIRSRPHLKENVSLPGNADPPGIHSHHLHATRSGGYDIMGQDE
jgi:hypothetical protein